MHATLWLHPAEIGWALGNVNSDYWQIFGVKVRGVLLDLILTGPYNAVCAGIFNGKTVFNRFLSNSWSNLYATFLLSACLILVIFDLVWPKNASFFKRIFFCLRENLAGIDQHHQGHIWTKNSRWLTPITSYSYTQIKKIYLENPDKIFLSGFLRPLEIFS